MPQSEVAQLRRQIELEFEAMQRGMMGLAMGVARHEFIRKRMDQVGTYQGRLAEQLGAQEAAQIVAGLYIKVVEQETGSENSGPQL